ncbi:MAG TPA: UDP-N-acetylmuramoyl-L-alanine--D-glutamate ligase [Polyangiaceae bacterium]
MLEFAKRAVVVGLGKSGIAAVRLLKAHGVEVIATDTAPLDRLSPEVRELDVPIFAGGHAGVPFGDVDVIVVSPGVPALAEITAAERAGVSAIGEIELACRFVRAPMIAVGGTNGKSTVTTLTALMLECSGFRTFSGGNLGTPLSDAVSADWERLVVEVSSFQLERVLRFKPSVSILLNITEDHLDRYPSFLAYAEAKGNAFIAQDAHDVAVVPFGDRACEEQARRGQGRLVRFGEGGDYVVEGRQVNETATGLVFSLESSRLHGAHNLSNAAASSAAARAHGATVDGVRRAIEEFQPLGHRMAFVAALNGVRYYDDSKGTNVGAAVTALLGLSEQRGVLIAGGRDKQGSYEPLVDALRKKGRALVVIGEAADAIAAAANGVLPVERATTMQAAVQAARQWAKPGDAVLLSPACASFDMFKGYAERGDHFARAVRELTPADDFGDAKGTPSC